MRSLEEALSEVQREVQVRKRCYPRWVSEGKLTRIDAADRLERLEAASEYLGRSQALAEATGRPPKPDADDAPF